MKIRNGFVSNSSSSSFILINPTKADLDYIQQNYADVLKLNNNLKKRVSETMWEDKVQLKEEDSIYLTNFISDGGDFNADALSCEVINYQDGGHGYPYGDYEDYNEIEGEFGMRTIFIEKDKASKEEIIIKGNTISYKGKTWEVSDFEEEEKVMGLLMSIKECLEDNEED